MLSTQLLLGSVAISHGSNHSSRSCNFSRIGKFEKIPEQGSTNCAHSDEGASTKLRARKSFKTLLSSTWMLFKVASWFCV